MGKLPAAAQGERRRQVIGFRQIGPTYDAIAAQVGPTRTGVFNGLHPLWRTLLRLCSYRELGLFWPDPMWHER